MKNPPILIAVIGFFAALAGFGFLFFGLRAIGFDWFGALGDLPALEHVGLWGWLALATGIIWLLAAFGLWALQPWARLFAMIVAGLGLLEAFIAFFQFPGTGIGFGMALMPGLILWYLTTSEAKAAFGGELARSMSTEQYATSRSESAIDAGAEFAPAAPEVAPVAPIAFAAAGSAPGALASPSAAAVAASSAAVAAAMQSDDVAPMGGTPATPIAPAAAAAMPVAASADQGSADQGSGVGTPAMPDATDAAGAAAAHRNLRVADVEGIGPAYGGLLVSAGVPTTDQLLASGATRIGRQRLAQATGIRGDLLLEWVNHIDLMRVPGVGPQYSDLLEAAGVDSPAELSHRNATNLAETVQEVVAARPGVVRRIPTQAEIAGWIKAAGSMPKVVEH